MFTHTRALVLFLAAAIVACAPGTTSGGAADFDRQFIDMMVPHHQAAVEMARVAQQRAEHPELKEMARSIIGAQQAEIDQMKSWRRSWYGSDQTPAMNVMPMIEGMSGGHGAGAMDMSADVEKLRNAPEPFDREFIDMMIAHHEMAIAAGDAAASRASRTEIRDLAAKIVRDQQAEISELRKWRAQWYGG